MAALCPGSDVQQPDVGVLALQKGRALVEILLAGHERQLVVGNLEDVTLGQAPADLGAGLLQAVPEGRAEVGVEGDQGAGLSSQGHRLAGGAAAGLPGQGQGAEVEDAAALQQTAVQVLDGQVGVCAGPAVKAEVPVAPRQGLDDGQGGVYVGVVPQA